MTVGPLALALYLTANVSLVAARDSGRVDGGSGRIIRYAIGVLAVASLQGAGIGQRVPTKTLGTQ